MAFLAVFLYLLGPAPACAGQAEAQGLPSARFALLLQSFADAAYRKGFLHLGEAKDCDHAHVLMDGKHRPIALLYHTQEWRFMGGTDTDSLDPDSRNWIQWVETGQVEDARKYKRLAYPSTTAWTWFRARDLPAHEAFRTVTDKMLDPVLLGAEIAFSRQWEFRRSDCADSARQPESISVRLPSAGLVCLRIKRS